jgi:hypothetical protein
VILIGVGGFIEDTGPIRDTLGNVYTRLESFNYRIEAYVGLGTSLWMAKSVRGGAPLTISNTKVKVPLIEMTLSAIEVKNASKISSTSYSYPFPGEIAYSGTVTTTGPAVLIAWWWGDGSGYYPHRAIPNNGFTVIGSALGTGDLVQACVAVKEVNAAGTYDVTWEMIPTEGALLWLIAVE